MELAHLNSKKQDPRIPETTHAKILIALVVIVAVVTLIAVRLG